MFLVVGQIGTHAAANDTICAECTRIIRSVKRAIASLPHENQRIFVYKID
jgi:hypothetical protein